MELCSYIISQLSLVILFLFRVIGVFFFNSFLCRIVCQNIVEKEQKIVPVQQDLKISSDIKEPLRPPTTKHTTIHAKLLRKQKTNLEKI